MAVTFDDVIVGVRQRFDGPALSLGLRGPKLLRWNTSFCLAYFGSVLGLQVLVEFDYFFIFAIPFRMGTTDELPEGFLDANHRRHAMYLQEALDVLGIPHDAGDREMKHLGGDYRNYDRMAELLSRLLAETWHRVCQDASKVFP